MVKATSPDLLMKENNHPLKAEIEVLRKIILSSSDKIVERVKWNAPSYYYIKDMAAFNLHQEKFVQLIFIFHNGTMINESHGLLQGTWKDRREARFNNMDDIQTKKPALQNVVRDWVTLMETNQTN